MPVVAWDGIKSQLCSLKHHWLTTAIDAQRDALTISCECGSLGEQKHGHENDASPGVQRPYLLKALWSQ